MRLEPAGRPHFTDWRLKVFYIFIAVVFSFFLLRLFNLMVIEGEAYQAQAFDNRSEVVSIPTQRGLIYDRNGYILARNVPTYDVVITPAYLPASQAGLERIYRELSVLIDVPVNRGVLDEFTVKNFSPCLTDLGITQIVAIGESIAPYTPIQIRCDVDEDIAKIVMGKAQNWPGVGVEIQPIRDYPTGETTAEVIGFLGPVPAAQKEFYEEQGFVAGRDKVGYAGVEASLQELLGGRNGERLVEVDAAGKIIRDLAEPVQPVPGYNVRLTLDTRLQLAAKEILKGEIKFWNTYLNEIRSNIGAVIAMNPKTGEVLALVSYPTYENNRMARFIPAYYYQQLSEDPTRPLFNHAISAEHPPGSVFKMAAAIGALNEGVITPEYLIEDPGRITTIQKFYENDPGTPRDYVCWNRSGHGMVDFLRGVANSCNVYFYKITGGYQNEVPGGGLGIWRLGEYARALGYARRTGIELPGEAAGLMPDPNWKRRNLGENWATGDTYIAGVGQGFVLSTVLQVLVSFSTLANDGVMMKPTLIAEVTDHLGNTIQAFEPEQVWDITKDPLINIYDENYFTTGELKTVQPWVVELAKQGMRMTVTEGTADDPLVSNTLLPSAGKTGTAEYCDNIAQEKNRCVPGNWPTHAWYAAYAPYDDPEIIAVAFVYNGGEGAAVAGPIVRKVLNAYFELRQIDAAKQ